MIKITIEYFQDGIVWKPQYDITSAVSFFKKVAELKHQHLKFIIKVSEI